MVSDRLAMLRRRVAVERAIAAVVALFVLHAFGFIDQHYLESVVMSLALFSLWLLMAAWVWLDSAYRGKARDLLVVFCMLTGPVALFYYLVTRPAVPDICAKCGNQIDNKRDTCPYCGSKSTLHKLTLKLRWVWQELLNSIAGGPVDRTKETVKHLTIGCAAATLFFWLLSVTNFGYEIFPIMFLFSAASYWVLLAWWVYLDASWRRMEPVPWGLLTLVTNIFGLVTYLVIRYPEPRACPQCSASLPTNLKRCPYCGSEVEPTCPRCQSPVHADWLFCPACAAQISRPQPAPPPVPTQEAQPEQPTVCIRGTVIDAITGAPVVDAEVKIDSRSNNRSTTTNAQGRYELPDMPIQPYVLLATAKDYAADAQPFEPSADTTAQVHFTLRPQTERVYSE